MYGEEFELVSDPLVLAKGVAVIDVIVQESQRHRRVRIPLMVVHMVEDELQAA
jgi:hypothetical protein